MILEVTSLLEQRVEAALREFPGIVREREYTVARPNYNPYFVDFATLARVRLARSSISASMHATASTIRHLSKSMGRFSKTGLQLFSTLITMKRNNDHIFSHAVLLVDDPLTAELYAGVFRQSYRVLTTSNLSNATQILTREHPEIIVVEPSIGGEEGWKWVKSMIQTYAIPTIICSTLDERKNGLNAGVSAYLIKPVPPAILSRVVASVLDEVL